MNKKLKISYFLLYYKYNTEQMEPGNLLLTQFNMLKHNINKVFPISSYKIINLNTNYKDLHAKSLKNVNHQILENVWQSCKVYKKTIACTIKSQNTVTWKHPEETHLTENNTFTKEYYLWKDKLLNNRFPVEFPIGRSNRYKYQFIVDHKGNIYRGSQGFHDAFKNIYISTYLDYVKSCSRFHDLKKEYLQGQNMLIVCDNLPYYPVKFNPDNVYYSSGFCLGLSLYHSCLMK